MDAKSMDALAMNIGKAITAAIPDDTGYMIVLFSNRGGEVVNTNARPDEALVAVEALHKAIKQEAAEWAAKEAKRLDLTHH